MRRIIIFSGMMSEILVQVGLC